MKKIAILITHGTDTLAWTHAFVRYSLKNNKINIAITGSQIRLPSMPAFSDAYINIANSVHFLKSIEPAHIFTVFNYGTQAFSDSLYKIDRWNNQAFAGDTIARMEWDEVKFADRSVEVSENPQKLDRLYLLTTGGTIASSYNGNAALAPRATSKLTNFIKDHLGDIIEEIQEREALVIDSSDISIEMMKSIVTQVVGCMHESGYSQSFADFNFDENVRIIYTDPFKTVRDYRRECDGASAIILAGYGGGNVNIDRVSNYTPLGLIEDLIADNIPVVLTSQVALGPADFVYENGRMAIEVGAMSGVDLSLPEIQMRLSYLLGHKEQIETFAKQRGGSYIHEFERLFTSGVKFRTKKSQKMYAELKGFTPIKEDLLINRTFEETLSQLEEF